MAAVGATAHPQRRASGVAARGGRCPLASLAAALVLPLLLCSFAAPAGAQSALSAAKDVGGIVKILGDKPRTQTATLSMWQQQNQGEKQAAFRLRAAGEVYVFALSREQLARFIDAIRRYQLAERQAAADPAAADRLYQSDIRLRRVGEEESDDTLIVGIERKGRQRATLSLGFASWQPAAGAADAPAGRSFRGVSFQYEGALALREVLQEMAGDLAQR